MRRITEKLPGKVLAAVLLMFCGAVAQQIAPGRSIQLDGFALEWQRIEPVFDELRMQVTQEGVAGFFEHPFDPECPLQIMLRASGIEDTLQIFPRPDTAVLRAVSVMPQAQDSVEQNLSVEFILPWQGVSSYSLILISRDCLDQQVSQTFSATRPGSVSYTKRIALQVGATVVLLVLYIGFLSRIRRKRKGRIEKQS